MNSNNIRSIGIMQGRLVPRYQKRYQAFPVGYWHAEFHTAREIGLNAIEFILDYNDAEKNPLMTDEGIEEIKKVCKESGTRVYSVCADYFMQAPFHSEHQHQSEEVLKVLIQQSVDLGVKDIVIPCVDMSSLKTLDDKAKLLKSLEKCIPLAEQKGIFLNLETDLAPQEFKNLLTSFGSRSIKVNYDIGNSASLGYNPEEEFAAYGEYISDLHVKDRKLGSSSVPLGTGDAKIELVFKLLGQLKFKGNICMQAARAEHFADDLPLVKKQYDMTRQWVERYL